MFSAMPTNLPLPDKGGMSVWHEKAEKNLERARLELMEYVSKRFEEEEKKQTKNDGGEIVETRSFRNSNNEE